DSSNGARRAGEETSYREQPQPAQVMLGAARADVDARLLVGGPALHDADFVQLYRAQLAQVARPVVILRHEAERHTADVATLGQREQISSGARVGQCEIEGQPVGVLAQRERARA